MKILYSDKFSSENNKAEYISSHISCSESAGVIRFYFVRVRYFSYSTNTADMNTILSI